MPESVIQLCMVYGLLAQLRSRDKLALLQKNRKNILPLIRPFAYQLFARWKVVWLGSSDFTSWPVASADLKLGEI